jgi:hypothetical protein
VLFGELSLPAQVLEGSLQLFCQVLKHDSKSSSQALIYCTGCPVGVQLSRGGLAGRCIRHVAGACL